MATLKSLTSFIGKVGDLVGYQRNGKTYVRALSLRTAPVTKGETENRSNFGRFQKWLTPIHPVLRIGYMDIEPDRHPLNVAKSLIYKQAMIKSANPPSLDPALVKISSGSLGNAENLQVVLTTEKILEFTWNPVISLSSSPRDRIMLLAYNPALSSCFHDTSGPRRSTGMASLSLDATASGSYHLYAAFVSEDLSRRSESVYLGEMEV